MMQDKDGRKDNIPLWYRAACPTRALALAVIRRGIHDAHAHGIRGELPRPVKWVRLASWVEWAGWPVEWLRSAVEGAPCLAVEDEWPENGGIGDQFDSPYPDNLILHARFLRREMPDAQVTHKLNLPGGTIARWNENGWV